MSTIVGVGFAVGAERLELEESDTASGDEDGVHPPPVTNTAIRNWQITVARRPNMCQPKVNPMNEF